MSITSGRYRWMGARTDRELSEPGINAGTESEWAEWERRRAEEDRLKRKIESWKKTVDVDLVDPSPPETIESKSISRECLTRVEGVQCVVQDKPVDVEPKKDLKAATTQAKLHDPLMARSGLGFSVVKRNTQALVGKPKPTPRNRDSDNAAPHVEELSKPKDHSAAQERNLQEDAGSLKQPSKPSKSENAQNVHVLSHSKLGQPDDLEASIPLKNQPTRTVQSIANISETRDQNPEQCRQKPAPIPSAPPSTPPSSITPRTSSPLLNKSKGQTRTSQSLPVIPTTLTGPNGHQTHKRPVSPTSPIGRPAKKARTMPVLPSSDIPASNATPPESSSPIAPTTPKSSDKDRIIPDSSPAAAAVGLTTPKRRPLPTLTELLASSKRGKKSGSPSRKPKSPMRVAAEQLMIKADVPNNDNDNDSNHAQGHAQITTTRITVKAGRFPSPLDNPFMLDPYALSAHHDELEPDVIASPTKSLSSIAESDSDPEEEDDEDGVDSAGWEAAQVWWVDGVQFPIRC
ncbi:uncharacterized protein LACBIDRAFT_293262 [Laccaria bicolor S238N-H82]|uniref:Predicted protein n=1 Tax=Laccaria bicolor (strain S238N-H82 / ATCC MYA-4686) TaxID=486041 RepID=B0D2E3_LACBS|nr:uncharacterized protein LACBIDRAFT_293262 [Laccaria bicolor S238N-H82]EDR10731.1 predicted protein [Laccaria bicolor S238N-H82]|eukprot:XP_001878032.1 predicted protein [Laccaria bicolor S238N-H82]